MFLSSMIARRRRSPVVVLFDVAAATDKTGGMGEDRRARDGRGVGRRYSSPVDSKQVTEVASTEEHQTPLKVVKANLIVSILSQVIDYPPIMSYRASVLKHTT